MTFQGNQGTGTFSLSDCHLILTAQLLLHLISHGGILQRALILLQVVVHLRGHAMQYGQTLWIVGFLRILYSLENIFFSFLRLAHRHIDSCQRIEA